MYRSCNYVFNNKIEEINFYVSKLLNRICFYRITILRMEI